MTRTTPDLAPPSSNFSEIEFRTWNTQSPEADT
ncbi:hypothetical protein AVEN_86681-1, partial [Araneus ventricosus]